MSERDRTMGRRVEPSRFGEVLTDIDEQLAKYANVEREANLILKKMGVPAPRRPDMPDMPQLRGPVSEMTDAELGDAQGDFAVWEAYLGPLVADAETQVEVKKSIRDYLLSKLKENATGPQAGRADKAKTDPRFVDADTDLLAAKRVLKALKAAFDGQETQRKVCSRYVEIRTREIDAHTRTENVQKRRAGAPRFRRTPGRD